MTRHLKAKKPLILKALLAAVVSLAALEAGAGSVLAGTIFVYNGPITTSQGTDNVNVSASFAISGNNLTVDLQNLGATPNTTYILTNLEWSIAGHNSTSLNNANSWWTTLGNTVKYNQSGVDQGANTGTSDQNQWDFAQSPGGNLGNGYNAEYAISTVSSSPNNIFNQIDGLNYGLVGPTTALGNNTNFDNLILYRSKDSSASGLEFTLTGLSGISESDITNVQFSFGSPVSGQGGVVFQAAFGPGTTAATPEPASWTLMVVGAAAFGWYRRRGVARTLLSSPN